MHRTAYFSPEKLESFRRVLVSHGIEASAAAAIARPDDPGPGAYLSNIEDRAKIRGYAREFERAAEQFGVS